MRAGASACGLAVLMLVLAGHARAEEAEPPVTISALYTADLWRNTSGGLRTGSRYLDNLDLMAEVDGERAFGATGLRLYVHGLYNNGEALSGDLVGDLQGVSNIETDVEALRLFEAWAEQRFAGGRASARFGLYDLNSEFDALESAGLFLNSSHGVAPDLSQTGPSGPSIFPVTALALRLDYQVEDHWLVRAAVLDGAPGDPARPARTQIRLSGAEGALLIAEAERSTPTSTLTVGAWTYTRKAEDLLATARAGAPVMRRGDAGAYAAYERRLTTDPDDSQQGLKGWVRTGLAQPRFNAVGWYLGGGLVYTGPFASRPSDRLGVAVASARLGGRYRDAVRLSGGETDPAETTLELTYRAELLPWLTLQPDVQYVINPGGDRGLKNALVTGLRIEIGF